MRRFSLKTKQTSESEKFEKVNINKKLANGKGPWGGGKRAG